MSDKKKEQKPEDVFRINLEQYAIKSQGKKKRLACDALDKAARKVLFKAYG